uniref:Uncharacterized protein n=1 Tax=Tetranychus urticae TaxID=32264 RepID=T1KEM5_TETUR
MVIANSFSRNQSYPISSSIIMSSIVNRSRNIRSGRSVRGKGKRHWTKMLSLIGLKVNLSHQFHL